ncbi:MAG: CDP-alcohol phosphatidyltransferase family protein [Spirochaetia bacterium]
MKARTRLITSIVATVLASTASHAALFLILADIYGVSGHFVRLFFLVMGLSNLVLLAFLLIMRGDFYLLPEGTQLDRINLANLLSVTRISSTPMVLFLLILSRDHDLAAFTIIFTSLVFLTDLFDGHVSRKPHQRTRIGVYLDAVSDYAILIAVSVAFDYYGLISRWFFVVVMFRLVFMFAGMAALLLYHGRVDAGSTLWGKILVSATMVLYAASLLELFDATAETARRITSFLEYVVAGVVVVSTLEKVLVILQAFREAHAEREERRTPEPGPHK